jgi:alkylhydroperoxidase family enzyme
VDINAIVADLGNASIKEPLRAALRLLEKLCRENTLTADDVRSALASGVTASQIKDALAVCFAFNITSRLANAFGFTLATQEAFDAGAQYLIRRGYQ